MLSSDSEEDEGSQQTAPEQPVRHYNLPLKDKIMMGPLDKYQNYSNSYSTKGFRLVPLEVPDPHAADHNNDLASALTKRLGREALPDTPTRVL